MHSLVPGEPFPEGSFAHAFLYLRELLASSRGLAPPWRLWLLVRTIPELSAMPHLADPIREEIKAISPKLTFQLESPLLVYLAAGAFFGERRGRFHLIETTVRSGDRRLAIQLAKQCPPARALAETGILARDGHRSFIAPLDPEAWPASIPMIARAAASGDVAVAERAARALEDSPQLRVWLAIARLQAGDPRAISTIACIKPSSLAKRAMFELARLKGSPPKGTELELRLIDHFKANEVFDLRLSRRERQLLWDPEVELPHLSAFLLERPRKVDDAIQARVLVHAVRLLELPQKIALEPREPTASCAFLRGLAGDRDFGATLPDRVRPWFDRGLASSPIARRVRRAVVDACRASLHRAFTSSEEDQGLVCCRLETLVELGGERAARALASALTRAWHPRHSIATFEALARVDSRAATSLLFKRYHEVAAHGRFACSMMDILERRGALEPGYTATFNRAVTQRHLKDLEPEVFHRWFSAYAAEWWRFTGRPVGIAVIEALSLGETVPTADPIGEVRAAFATAAAAREEAPLPLVRNLLRRPILLRHLLCFTTHRYLGGGRWTIDRWQKALRSIDRELEPLRPDLVRRFAEKVRPDSPDLLAERLLLGRHPIERCSSVDLGGGWSLHYLDETKDLFGFLRFADSVPCCYNSASEFDAQIYILGLWKDPLSFCFSIERRAALSRESHGFVFGSFGTSHDDRPIALLNGIYLRRQDPQMRFQILNAIEESFARPLQLSLIGIASQFGGAGPLPPEYEAGAFLVRRWRAFKSKQQTSIYDDIGLDGNEADEAHLFWKQLPPSGLDNQISLKVG